MCLSGRSYTIGGRLNTFMPTVTANITQWEREAQAQCQFVKTIMMKLSHVTNENGFWTDMYPVSSAVSSGRVRETELCRRGELSRQQANRQTINNITHAN